MGTIFVNPSLKGNGLQAIRLCPAGLGRCLDKRTGKVLWSQDPWKKQGGNRLVYGYSSSLLASRDTIILLVAGDGKVLAMRATPTHAATHPRWAALNKWS